MRSSSHRKGEALAGAPLDNAPKEYPPKIQQLVQDIAGLTLLEISDLNELLKVLGKNRRDRGLVSVLSIFGEFGELLKVCFSRCQSQPGLALH
jgi:large subunit ribosomal protein L7/L12